MKDEKHIRDSTTNTIDGINDKLPVRLDLRSPLGDEDIKKYAMIHLKTVIQD